MNSLRERFLARVEIAFDATNEDCWLWVGPLYRGRARLGKRNAARISYVLFKGKLGRFHALHKCDNPRCVNPQHLFAGSHQTNMKDKRKKGRCPGQNATHCKNGHPLSGDNLYRRPSGGRACKACRKAANEKYQRNQVKIAEAQL